MAEDEGAPQINWAGRNFGQLTPNEQRRVIDEAASAMQDELRQNADAIATALDETDPGAER